MEERVFVASTIYDLLDVRSELESHLRSMGLTPVLSESATSDFFAHPNADSIETCLVNMQTCNYLIVILSQRYGPSLKKAGYKDVSATHLEYQKAIEHKIPIFFYVRDRLESEFRIWQRNNRQKKRLEFRWVVRDSDLRLLSFLEEHQKLIAGSKKNNWYQTFRTSIDLKELVTRDFRKPASKAKLSLAVQENRLPILQPSYDIISKTAIGFKLRLSFRNFGTTPAYQVRWRKVDINRDFQEIAIVAPSYAFDCYFHIPLNCRLTEIILISYLTSIGFCITDSFEYSIHPDNLSFDKKLIVEIRQIDRKYSYSVRNEAAVLGKVTYED